MAVSGDFFTIEGLADIADKGEFNLEILRSQMFGHGATDLTILNDLINKLERLYNDFSDREKAVLTLLNASNIEEVNNRLEIFYSESGYHKFVDFNMKTIMAEFDAATNAEKEKARLEYQAIFQNLLKEVCHGNVAEVVKREGKEIAIQKATQELARLTQAGTGTGKGRNTPSIKLGKSVISNQNGFEFLPEQVTQMVRNRFDELKRRAAGMIKTEISEKDKEELIRLTTIDSIQTKTTSSSAEINLGGVIGKLTGNTTPTQADNLPPKEREKINYKIRKAILQQIEPQYRETARQIMNQMLTGEPSMFFTGGSAAKLRGTLGEIGAMHAIAHLLGMDAPNQEIIQWVATATSGGKQLSVDIVLKDLRNIDVIHNDSLIDIGVQVKNVQDLIIDFVDADFNTVTQKLGFESSSLENVIYADLFNVPYRKNGPYEYARSQNPESHPFLNEYMSIDQQIDEIAADFRLFLTTYAPDFLYMGLGPDFSNKLATLSQSIPKVSGNVIYLVNKKMYSAAKMLAEIDLMLIGIKHKLNKDYKVTDAFKLDNSLPGGFGINMYLHNSGKDVPSQTIVDYLNGSATIESLSKQSVKIKSSYNFRKV